MPPDPQARPVDLAQERVFLEGLMNARFNFLVVLYGVVVAAAATSPDRASRLFALGAGMLACLGLAMATHRAYLVLVPICEALWADQTSAIGWATQQVRASRPHSKPANELIGKWLPLVFVTTLGLAFAAVFFGWWSHPLPPR